MAAGDTFQRIGPNDHLILNLSGRLVGVRNPHGNGGDLRFDPLTVRRLVTVDDLPLSGLYYAHRGSSRDGRPMGLEGSRSAYVVAAGLGASVLDGDMRETRDGVPVVGFHDPDTSSTSDVTVTASATALVDLPQHYQPAIVGSGNLREDFYTLEQMFAEFGGRVVIDMELKNGAAASLPAFAALVAKFGLSRSVLVNTSSASDAALITAAGLLLHFVNCRTTAHLDTAAANGAWMIDIATDASPSLVDYALTKGFSRIIGGFVNTAGSAVSTSTFAAVAAMDSRLNGFASDALGYLGRTGGVNVRSSDSISGAIRSGKRPAGCKIVNSANLTDWLSPGNLYLRKGAGAMVYTFGSLAGSAYPSGVSAGQPAAKQTLTAKFIFDTLPTTTTQYAALKLYSPTEDPTNASSDTIEGYKIGFPANGAVFCNTIPIGGGGASAVFPTLPGIAAIAGTEYTVTVDIDDSSAGSQKIRVTRQDAVATLSGAVGAGTITSLPVNALAVALPNGTKLLLPDGTQVNCNGTAAAAATSITVSSVTVAALSSGAALRATSGYITETLAIWRGNYHSAYTTLSDGTLRITDLSVA